ncbi:unnamed protein product [Prorocentrum cordatum]|uniref:Uncharacterized protein n=1 Tax=Prorocentrum cordatum TaxID=2364126 RepID=A0ABN9TNZ8_9DINO|nr:unnamed protein product [Polarella glacialis]
MPGHHPVQTSWSGWYEDERVGTRDNMSFDTLIINNRKVQGHGEDAVGKFSLEGKAEGGSMEFDKTYEGAHTVVYRGRLRDLPEGGQIIEGEWHLQSAPEVRGIFELSRSLEMERKREAAFQMVVARMKMIVGFIRFFLEDVGFSCVQLLYLFWHEESMSPSTRNFTILSLAAGLFLSIAGPISEALKSRRLMRAGGELASPGPPPSVDGGNPTRAAGNAYKHERLADEETPLEEEGGAEGRKPLSGAYRERLEKVEAIQQGELLTGNLDYIDLLMERPDRPAEVPDIAITDIIVTSRGVHAVLLGSVVMHWLFVASVPFVFSPSCHAGAPAKAHLGFMCIAFLCLFTQIWVAAFTKYGYLMLIHAPQQFGFSLLLSFLGNFDAYSDIIFVAMARDCGSKLWMPAAAIYVVGVVCAQALPGIALLAAKHNIPAALKLTELNVLLVLLKPSVG